MNHRLRLLRLVLVLSTLLLCSHFTYAQKNSKIKGVITDSLQKPMAGATIIQVGGSAKTVADSKGAFELNAPADSYLQIEMIGYQSQTIKASEGMVVRLQPKITSLDDVVVVGYGSQKKGNLTTAVSTINTKEMANVSTSNLSNILAGRAAGVFIQTGTGVPGSPSSVRIRSSSSWNSGGPIYVVDGIVRDQVYFDALDPNQVQDMTILKDAAAAAIYGSRSSDGVLLVTTKTGKKGKPTFQFNSIVGVYNKQGIDVKYLGMDESMDMYNTMHSQPGDARFNDYDRNWIHQHNPEGNLHVDELYRMPLNQRYSANVSGGNDMMTYFVAGSYYHENGFLPHMDYRKYNLRSNIQMNVTRNLTLGLNLNYNNGLKGRIASETDNADYNIAYLKYIMSPLSYAYIDGKPIATDWVTNPVEAINNGGYRNTNQQNIDGLISLDYKVPFVKGLSIKGIADLYNTNAFIKAYGIQPLLYKFKKDPNSGVQQMYTNEVIGTQYATSPARPYVGNENERTNSYQLNGIVTYDTHFGDHHLNVTGVYEQADGYYRYSSIYKYNFPVYQTDQLPFASPNPGDAKANGYEKPLDSRVSYVGRLNYDFQSKYLLSASMRADGSSKFSKENRWGYFPAVSLGWVVSKENFMRNTSNVVDFLKLRMSYGITGNDNIPPFLYKEYYNASNNSYYLGTPGALQPTLDYNGMAQPNYTWEGAKSFDAGVEFNFLKHWNFTADFWSKNTYDILGQRILQTPVEFGTSYPVENYGKMDAKGMDIELGYMNGKIGRDFTFDVKANFGLATTNVVLKDKPLGALPAEDPVGKPLNYLVGYHATGILRTDADVAALPAGYKIFGVAPQKGMMNFQDVSGPNGKADGIIDNYDKVVLANYSNTSSGGYGQTGSMLNAPIAYGFILNMQYKAFALNAVFGGLAGYKVSYNDPWNRANTANIPFPAYYADSYSDANPNGSFPKLYNASGNQRSDYSVSSELNTFNGAFLRLKNINLSYSLPVSTLHKAGISSTQIFVSGANLFCFRKFKLYDPEVYSFGSYPIMKSLSVGLNLQF
ncbi:SusC/RagA family TonB-linked outer membrane protein [Chitinophagaceae bacterium 26-R-25]|nr:SusC/RagA family TonB-linked outer membrane protein [Chitinophagaceae bacterium 26-R-25]